MSNIKFRKAILRLVPVTELPEEYQSVYSSEYGVGVVGTAMDMNSCQVKFRDAEGRFFISDLKKIIAEWYTKSEPTKPTFLKGISLTKYKSDMKTYEASRKTLPLADADYHNAIHGNSGLTFIDKEVTIEEKACLVDNTAEAQKIHQRVKDKDDTSCLVSSHKAVYYARLIVQKQ